jgi:hypothetical protein
MITSHQHPEDTTYGNIMPSTISILFLGTPHKGTAWGRVGTWLARLLLPVGSNPVLLSDLYYDSVVLFDINKEFCRVARSKLRITNFYEKRRAIIFDRWGIRLGALVNIIPPEPLSFSRALRGQGMR